MDFDAGSGTTPRTGSGFALQLYSTGSLSWAHTFVDGGSGTSFITFVWKLDAHGGFEWVGSLGTQRHRYGKAIPVDASGNVYTAGRWSGSGDCGEMESIAAQIGRQDWMSDSLAAGKPAGTIKGDSPGFRGACYLATVAGVVQW